MSDVVWSQRRESSRDSLSDPFTDPPEFRRFKMSEGQRWAHELHSETEEQRADRHARCDAHAAAAEWPPA